MILSRLLKTWIRDTHECNTIMRATSFFYLSRLLDSFEFKQKDNAEGEEAIRTATGNLVMRLGDTPLLE